MRAYVMARKGVLLTDPSVKEMSMQQWMFEYAALAKKEKDNREFIVKAMKGVLVSTLGLNMLRPEDAAGNPKPFEEFTEEDKEQFIPLTAWVGNEGMLKAVKEQLDKVKMNVELPPVDDNYEAMVAAIDAAEGDIEPIIGLDKLDIPDNPKKAHDEKVIGVLNKTDVDVGDM